MNKLEKNILIFLGFLTSPAMMVASALFLFSIISATDNRMLSISLCYIMILVGLILYQRLKQLDRYKITILSWLFGRPRFKSQMGNTFSVFQGFLKTDNFTDDIQVFLKSSNQENRFWNVTIKNNSFRFIGKVNISKTELINLIAPDATPNSYTRSFVSDIDKIETKFLFPKRAQTFSVPKILGFKPTATKVQAVFLYLDNFFKVPYPYFRESFTVGVNLSSALNPMVEEPLPNILLQEINRPISVSYGVITLELCNMLKLPESYLHSKSNPIEKMIAYDLTHVACLIPMYQKKNEFGRLSRFIYEMFLQGEKLGCSVDLGSKETIPKIHLSLEERSEDLSEQYVVNLVLALLEKEELLLSHNRSNLSDFPIDIHRKSW